MKQLLIRRLSDKQEVAQIDYNFAEKNPKVIAMYAIASRLALALNNVWDLIKFILMVREDCRDPAHKLEQQMIIEFDKEYSIEYIDWDEKLNSATSIADLFN